jgi:hypothetical protein
MKDQYVGDIGDFEKYSVLRAFQRSIDLPLVVCWMMTDADSTGEECIKGPVSRAFLSSGGRI